jgi:hypothetical protein
MQSRRKNMLPRSLVPLFAFAGAAPLAAQVTIDFEDLEAPCIFVETNPLREEYASLGAHFSGPGPLDGGAVLDQCGGFGLQAHSGIAFLAFNAGASMMNGGSASGPETIRFDQVVASASIWAGAGSAVTVTLDAYKDNVLVDTHTLTTQAWAELSVESSGGIDRLVVSSTSGVFVLDDLSYVPTAALPYCTAKPNSLGCPTTFHSSGVPSATATGGFTIIADHVLNQKLGVLLYSVTGRTALPFQGGILCVASPVLRTPPRLSAGHLPQVLDCSGGYRYDMNEFAAGLGGGNPHPDLRRPGTFVHCQIWSRDPGFAPPNSSALTAALQYVIGP